ncbi:MULTISPECIES: FruA-associating protein, FapA [Corallococcus]|uniref:FruA-associating protein, FapA n=1 Tax=Corallococcus TaxID=83461 RepID=UPI0011C3CEE9|nr:MULTISPECIES: FruA-associating protein, FapA [Corallococcus]
MDFHPTSLDLNQVEPTPQVAGWLRMRASQWLTTAQKDFNAALFARDGSEASFDRYADARSELDSAEAWALRVSEFLAHVR